MQPFERLGRQLGCRVCEESDSRVHALPEMHTKQASKLVYHLAERAGAPALHGAIHCRALAESATCNVQQQTCKHRVRVDPKPPGRVGREDPHAVGTGAELKA